MKQTRKNSKKVCYFPKDYAPARVLANQKKSRKKSAKYAKQLKTFFSKLNKSSKKLLKKVHKGFAKLLKNLRAKHTRKAKTTTSLSNHSAASSARAYNFRASSYKPIPKPRRLTWREGALLSIIGTCAVMIAFTFVFTNIADPVKRSEQELAKIADAYYIEHLYPHALGRKLYQPETVLADYAAQGLPAVHLRQLLLYNNGQFADSASVFNNRYYQCDTAQTFVRYYPVEPYGPRDYTVVYGTACEKPGAID